MVVGEEVVKALTIWQPWASLIMAGAKPFEFRGWNPRLRGPGYAFLIGKRIVIHAASKKIDRQEVQDLITILTRGGEGAAETCLHADKALPILEEALKMTCNCSLPFSAGLGTVLLGEPRKGTDIAAEFGVPRANDSDRDDHSNWGWPMLEIDKWPEPVSMRGFQGYWNWPTPETAGL
jgi:hypothetical protein